MRISLFLAILLLTFSTIACAEEAASAKPSFRSFINGISCGEIVKGLDQEETRKAYVLMVGSFITGANYAKNRDSKTDLRGMLQLTEQFCRQNPEHPVLTAMIFVDKAIDKRISLDQ